MAQCSVLIAVRLTDSFGRKALDDCLTSVLNARDVARTHDVQAEIIVADDRSAPPIAPTSGIRLVRNSGTPGKAGALNFALRTMTSELVLFTDADCIVSPDWIVRGVSAFHDDDVSLIGGPNWHLSGPRGICTGWLLANESKLLRSIQMRNTLGDRCSRIDLRNFAARRRVFERVPFFEQSVLGFSAEFSYEIRKRPDLLRGMRFLPSLTVIHQERPGVILMVRKYWRRGFYGSFSLMYRAKHGGLLRAFAGEYWRRHFVDPIELHGVSAIYTTLMHGAFWCGIFCNAMSRGSHR